LTLTSNKASTQLLPDSQPPNLIRTVEENRKSKGKKTQSQDKDSLISEEMEGWKMQR